jgi:hypothetical protein
LDVIVKILNVLKCIAVVIGRVESVIKQFVNAKDAKIINKA